MQRRDLLWLALSTPFGIVMLVLSFLRFTVGNDFLVTNDWLTSVVEAFREVTFAITSLMESILRVPFPQANLNQFESDALWLFYVFIPPSPSFIFQIAISFRDLPAIWLTKNLNFEEKLFETAVITTAIMTLIIYVLPLLGFAFTDYAHFYDDGKESAYGWVLFGLAGVALVVIFFRLARAAAMSTLSWFAARNYVGLMLILWYLYDQGLVEVVEAFT